VSQHGKEVFNCYSSCNNATLGRTKTKITTHKDQLLLQERKEPTAERSTFLLRFVGDQRSAVEGAFVASYSGSRSRDIDSVNASIPFPIVLVYSYFVFVYLRELLDSFRSPVDEFFTFSSLSVSVMPRYMLIISFRIEYMYAYSLRKFSAESSRSLNY